MDKIKALQKLLNGTASEADVELLKRLLTSGEVSIGGNVNQSVIIIGSGNKVELTSGVLGILKLEMTKKEIVEDEPPYTGSRYLARSQIVFSCCGRGALYEPDK